MKRVTIKDIAKELGITVGTVSHALNGINDISEKTRERVLKTAKEMGYISNASAVALRSGKTKTVAIIIPELTNLNFAYQIKMIEEKLKEKGYLAVIMNTDEDDEAEYNAIRTACGRRVDGILLCPAQHSKDNINFLNKIEIPYVLISRYFPDMETDYVCADDVRGGYLAGKYLLGKGYKNPIYIGPDYIRVSNDRYEGVAAACRESGIKMDKSRFVHISPKAEELAAVMQSIAERNTLFDSIIAFSDLIAYQIMAQQKFIFGAEVPVVGFGAVNTRLPMPFKYASVGMEEGGWGEKASAALLSKINGSQEKFQERIDVKLFEFNNECTLSK